MLRPAQAYIDAKQEAADAIVCSNPGVLEDFRRREAQIAELEVQAQAALDKVALVRQLIEDLKVCAHPRITGQACKGTKAGSLPGPADRRARWCRQERCGEPRQL